MSDSPEMAGGVFSCVQCGGQFQMPHPEPPPVVVRGPSIDTSQRESLRSAVRPRDASKEVVRAALLGAFIGAAVCVPIGFLMSQYAPFTGGWLVMIAEPFSPARLHSVPSHCLILGLTGSAVGGLFFGALRHLG